MFLDILLSLPLIVFSVLTLGLLYCWNIYHLVRKRMDHKPKFAPTDPDVIIVGGGLTGSSMATVLARDGRKVVVIEKNMSPPNTIRGEGLLPGAVKALEELGLKDILQDHRASMPLNGLVFTDFRTNLEAIVTFPRLGVTGRHGSLIQALREHAKLKESIRFIEGVGKDLVKESNRVVGIHYQEKGAFETKIIRAPLTIICDGYHSNLRKVIKNHKQTVKESCVIAVELEDTTLPHPNYVQISVGLDVPERMSLVAFQIDAVTTRLSVTLQEKPKESAATFLSSKVAPKLPGHLQGPLLVALQKDSPRVTFQCIRRSANFDSTPGVLVLGDAMSTRDPIVASGMTVALNDVKFWRNTLRTMSNLSDDNCLLTHKAHFQTHRRTYSFSIDITAHFIACVISDSDNAAIKLQQAWIRSMKELEKDSTSKEERKEAYKHFALLNLDAGETKKQFQKVCLDAMVYSFMSRPWTAVISAAWESLTIYLKYRQIMNIET